MTSSRKKTAASRGPRTSKSTALADKARRVIDQEIEGLRQVRKNLGPEFDRTVAALMDCLQNGRKIVVSGIGKNLHIAQKISSTLASTGSTSVVLNPSQAMHGDLGIFTAGDMLLALSYSGESDELVKLIPLVRRLGVGVISMTCSASSSLAQCSDLHLNVSVPREACPFNMAPTVSTTATLALGDALAMVLLEARGFRKEDYAKLHPGGAIGRALLVRVRDIMRTGPRVAVVPATATVKDAILAMTSARSGSAGIVDEKGALIGIFTDGDLRRLITENRNVVAMPVRSVMTASPKTVVDDCLAVDVLSAFETFNIDDLMVVDHKGHLVGAVDIQDLPKLKIM